MEALVIVDVQNDFISGTLGTKEAEAIIEPLVNKINSFDGIILITKDTHDKNYLSTQEGQKLPVEHCIKGTFGWEIDSRLMEAIKDKGLDYRIFEKDTFGSISLGEHIVELYKDGKIDSIEFVGVCTDICVISNSLLVKAMLPELPVRVDAACCAGVTPKAHEAALITMESCQIEIINNVEYSKHIKQ
ncbi:MAG: cysteine hydrolase [Clostridiales bacterium]|nr:cysteine hydrolase [Clostridiales bacterium]